MTRRFATHLAPPPRGGGALRVLRSRKLLVLLAAFAAAGVAAAVAVPAVISQQVINDTDRVHFRVFRQTADGLDTGWHVHPGVSIIQMQEGSMQIFNGSCTPTTVGPGQTIIEVPHLPVRGVATGRVSFTVTLITNGGDLPSIPFSAYSGVAGNPCP